MPTCIVAVRVIILRNFQQLLTGKYDFAGGNGKHLTTAHSVRCKILREQRHGSIGCSETRTVGARSVRALWTLPLGCACSDQEFSSAQFVCCKQTLRIKTETNTRLTTPFPWLPGWAGTSSNLDFTEARDSEWQWHQLGYMQVCTSLQTTTPALHYSVFYRPDALPTAQNRIKTANTTITWACFLP